MHGTLFKFLSFQFRKQHADRYQPKIVVYGHTVYLTTSLPELLRHLFKEENSITTNRASFFRGTRSKKPLLKLHAKRRSNLAALYGQMSTDIISLSSPNAEASRKIAVIIIIRACMWRCIGK